MGLHEGSDAEAAPEATEATGAASAGSESDGVPVRIHAHPSLCLGWGNCHRFAPEVYPLDEDGQIGIHRMEVPGELAHAAWIGASVCPEQAITVIRTPPPGASADRTTDRSAESASPGR